MIRAPWLLAAGAAGGGLIDGLLHAPWGVATGDALSLAATLLVAVGVPAGIGAAVGATLPRGLTERLPPAALAWGAGLLTLATAVVLATWGPPPALGAPEPVAPRAVLLLAVLALGLALALVGQRLGPWPQRGLALLALLGALPLPRAGGDPPRMLLVTVDGLRADAVLPDGPLARLAARGVTLDRAVAPVPATGPAHAALLTGRGPWDTGHLHDGVPVAAGTTLAEALADAGWSTGAVVSSDLLTGGLGFDRGFDRYDDEPGWIRGLDRVATGRLLAGLGLLGAPARRAAPFTVDRALAQIAAGQAFTWVHLEDPVGPYTPGDPWDKRFIEGAEARGGPSDGLEAARPLAPEHGTTLDGVTDPAWVSGQYRGEVARVEHHLDSLLRAVDDDVIVVVAGSFGESLGEGGRWFRHGGAWPVEVRVPVVVCAPGLPTGTTVPWPVELADLAPTLLDLAGVGIPATMTGTSLRPTLEQGAPIRPVARAVAAAGTLDEPVVEALAVGPRGAARAVGEGAAFRVEEDGSLGEALSEGRLGEVARTLAAQTHPRGPARLGPGGANRLRRLGGTAPVR